MGVITTRAIALVVITLGNYFCDSFGKTRAEHSFCQTRHKRVSRLVRTRVLCVFHESWALVLAKLAHSRSFCQYSCPRLVNTHETRALRSSSSVGEYRRRQRLALERSPTAYAHNTRRTSVPVGLPNIRRVRKIASLIFIARPKNQSE